MTARPIGNPEGDNPARNPKWTAEVDSTSPDTPKTQRYINLLTLPCRFFKLFHNWFVFFEEVVSGRDAPFIVRGMEREAAQPFQQTDIKILADYYHEDDEEGRTALMNHLNNKTKVALFSGVLHVEEGNIQENISIIHARSLCIEPDVFGALWLNCNGLFIKLLSMSPLRYD